MGKLLSKYIFGDAKPEPVFENAEIAEIRKIIQTEGPSGLARHIDIKKEIWKEEPIKFGIAGRPNTGKSIFINSILNVNDGNARFDQVESCDGLSTLGKYCHPIKKQLLLSELPGIGSENWKQCEFMSKTQLWEYDYFFIVFDTVLHQEDLWLAQQFVKMKKPFVLVRSKVDLDIELGCGEDVRSILKDLREETLLDINNSNDMQANIGICFISCFNEEIGELTKLKNHIDRNLESKKSETILYSLIELPKEIIKTKSIFLKRRLLAVTAVVSIISATRLSGIEVGINIAFLASVLYYFTNELGLCRMNMKYLINSAGSQIKCSELEKTKWKPVRCILHQLPKFVALTAFAVIHNQFGVFGPFVGAVVVVLVSGPIAYNFLTNILDNLTHESIISYDHVVSKHVQRHTSIRALLELH